MTGEKSKSSLSRRFSLSTIVVVTIILFMFSVTAIFYSTVKINQKLRDRLENVSTIAGASLQSAMWNLERETIKDIIDALSQEDEVVYFRLSDETGAYYEKKAPEFTEKNFPFFGKSSEFVTKVSEINFKCKQIGKIELAISKKIYNQELWVSIISIIVLAVIIAIAISLTSIVTTKKHIFTPLRELRDSATRIADGDLETQIDISGKDEIGTLAKAFNGMRKALKKKVGELKNTNQKLDEANKTLEQKVELRTSELYKSQQKLKTIIDNLRRRVYWKDIKGVIEGGNKALVEALKLSKPEDLKGMTEANMWKREEVVNLFRSLTKESIGKKEPKINVIESIIDDSGDHKWLRIDCIPLKDEKGDVTGVLVTYRDITEEKQYEEELEKERDKAEKANKAKDQFLAKVSHEVRTPMNSIIGFIEQVLQSRLNLKQRNYLNIVNSSSRDLLRIINDILDFSKMESGELQISLGEFHLRNVLDDVINTFYNEAAEKNIELLLVREKGVPESLLGDDLRLKQVLKNLVGNAIRFTEKGKVSLTVSCVDKKEGAARINFLIKDTGIGISDEDKEKIFLPYQQLHETTRGVGLGLTISRQLVALMGGELNVKSELEKGSTFYFSINFETKGYDSKELTGEPLKLDFTDLQGLKVLVVEDDKGSRLLMQTILSNHKIRVECAENGKEAIEKVTSTSYDVVLMDMQLPILSGYEATKIIRQELQLSRLPIIAVTASAIVGDKQECLAAGADDYISKPISADDLLLFIKKWKIRGRERVITNELAGIDVEGALERLRVDMDVFKQSLADFLESYGSMMEMIKDALIKQDMGKARNLLHTLRGAAVNIGANEVESFAKKLGEAIKFGTNKWKQLVNDLDIALNTVLKSIRSVIPVSKG
jgi:two-component system sensor histidine kinase/response regulator